MFNFSKSITNHTLKSALITSGILSLALVSNLAMASTSDITGQWLIKEKGETATVTIHPSGNHYVGTITQGKQYVGQTIITNLTASGQGKYTGGTITDPTNGKHYKLNAEVKGNQLILRGFVGTPMLGANQTWYRK